MRHSRYTRLLNLILMIGLIALPAATLAAQPPGAVQLADDEINVLPGNPIQIAVAMFMGYPAAQDTIDAVQLAFDDYGSIKGFDLQKNVYDAGCDEPTGTAAGTAIVAETQNVGVIGPFCSVSTHGLAPVLESAGVVMISPTNSHLGLYSFGPNVFNRTVITDPDFEAWVQEINRLPAVAAWRARFLSTFGRGPDELSVFAYDAASVLLKRLDQVSHIDSSASLVIDRSDLATAVRNTFEFSGVTGSITLSAFGDRVNTLKEYVWHDPFTKKTLDSHWSWVDEDSTHWSLTARPGFMRIITQDPYPNRLIRSIPAGNFSIRTRMLFEPSQNYQFAGLLVFLNQNNYLSFGRAFCDAPAPNCVNNGIYFDHIEGGDFVPPNFATSIAPEDEVYLQVVREGNVYTAYASANGTEWNEIGSHTIGFKPIGVGLYANNQISGDDEIPADFDFFLMTFKASQVFLPFTANQ